MAIANRFVLPIDIKAKTESPSVFFITQNDTVVFEVHLLDAGVPIPLSTDEVAFLTTELVGGDVARLEGTLIEENRVEFAITPSKEGFTKAVVQVYDEDGRVSTLPFSYSVNRDPVTANNIIEKSSQLTPTAPVVSDITRTSAVVSSPEESAQVRMNGGAWFDSPHKFEGLSVETSYTVFSRIKESSRFYESPQSPGTTFKTLPQLDDLTNAPGPKTLIGGTMEAGFFGEYKPAPPILVTTGNHLPTNAILLPMIGIPSSGAVFMDEPLLKFAWKGKIIFINKKPILPRINYTDLINRNAIYGGSTGVVTAQQYLFYYNLATVRVRLMRGANVKTIPVSTNPINAIGGAEDEWSALIKPIHVDYNDWGVGYTDEDLQIGTLPTLCQETQFDPQLRYLDVILRGTTTVDGVKALRSGSSTTVYGGIRFVLEYVDHFANTAGVS